MRMCHCCKEIKPDGAFGSNSCCLDCWSRRIEKRYGPKPKVERTKPKCDIRGCPHGVLCGHMYCRTHEQNIEKYGTPFPNGKANDPLLNPSIVKPKPKPKISPPKIIKRCPRCGDEFRTRFNRQIHCSHSCARYSAIERKA